ncbi:MAG: hypothetical protein ABI383_06065, partial [Acidobacteriaceae bacterium]
SGITVGNNYVDLGLPSGAILVGSLRYTGALQIRLAALTTSESQAAALLGRMQSALTMARAIGRQGKEQDDPAAQIVNSVSLKQSGNKAVLTADIPDGLLHELATAATPKTPQD